jgi:hypothetical protein
MNSEANGSDLHIFQKLESPKILDNKQKRVHDMVVMNLFTLEKHFQYGDEIIYLAIGLIDRYLVKVDNPRSPALLASAAYIIAGNYVDDNYDCCILSSELLDASVLYLPGVTRKSLIRCQLDILDKIDWKIRSACAFGYLQILCDLHKLDIKKIRYLCRSMLFCKTCCEGSQLVLALAILVAVYNYHTNIERKEVETMIAHIKHSHPKVLSEARQK